jgi:hypothetical protein
MPSDLGDLCVLLHPFPPHSPPLWCHPHQLGPMVPPWLLNSDLIRVPWRRLLERPELSVEQPGCKEAPPRDRTGVRRASDLVATLQTVLL